MELIDNINLLLGDDLRRALKPGARLKVAAPCFSMYSFEALKAELEQVDELHFIFTSPTFVAEEVMDKIRKERRDSTYPSARRRWPPRRSNCGPARSVVGGATDGAIFQAPRGAEPRRI